MAVFSAVSTTATRPAQAGPTGQWEGLIAEVAEGLSKAHVLTFFQKSEIQKYENRILVVALAREFYRGWAQQHARKPLLAAIRQTRPECQDVQFVVDGTLEQRGDFDPRRALSPADEPAKKRKLPGRAETQYRPAGGGAPLVSRSLRAEYTLQNFYPGEGSKMAHSAAVSAANSPGQQYNPLFLFGSVGMGKTHLLHGMGNALFGKGKLPIVVSAQHFTDEVIRAARGGNADELRKKYRRADALLLDDVQFLTGKTRTQEMLFHLFNDLHEGGKQIAFASDRAPSELENLPDRLVSRFQSGLVCQITPPDFETRLAILQMACQQSGALLPRSLLESLAGEIADNVRDLLGALRQVLADIELRGRSPGRTRVLEILAARRREHRDRLAQTGANALPRRPENPQQLLERVAAFFDVAPADMCGPSRRREYLAPRQLAMWLLHRRMGLSLMEIGALLGGRDHSSVLNSVRRVESQRKTDPQNWRRSNELRRKLGL